MNNRLRIATVANNYGKSHDGIGAYARVQGEELSKYADVTVFTAECKYEDSKIHKIICMGMTKQLFMVAKKIDCFDVIIIDYLFVEWNPAILIPLIKINHIRHKRGCKLVISLHEYGRVRNLRKRMIRKMCSMADLVFVADENLKCAVLPFSRRVSIRPIPSNLYCKEIVERVKYKDRANYIYFGLINKAKAFDEMLEAWDRFNYDGRNILYVVSSSRIDSLDNHKNVVFKYNLRDEQILEIMASCSVSIVPVIPEVDMKNATFKTSSMMGCISVGRFCEEFTRLPFTITMQDYSVESFFQEFIKVENLSDLQMDDYHCSAREFGKMYTPPEVIRNVYYEVSTLVSNKGRDYI